MIPCDPSEDREGLQRLIQAARAAPPSPALLVGPQADQAGPFEWTSPHRFDQPMIQQLRAAGEKLAARLRADLQPLLRFDLQLKLASVSEHYAWHLGTTLVPAGGYALALTLADGSACGFVILSDQKALALVEKMLGSTSAPAESRKLSPLESALLSDVLTALGRSSEAGCREVGLDLKVTAKAVPAAEVLPKEGCDEYCRLSLASSDDTGESINFVFSSRLLGGAEDPAQPAGKSGAHSPERARQIMLDYISAMPVQSHAVLGTAFAPFGDILALQPGDVLILDGRLQGPMELRVGHQVVLYGRMVMTNGQYALQVIPPPARLAGRAKPQQTTR